MPLVDYDSESSLEGNEASSSKGQGTAPPTSSSSRTGDAIPDHASKRQKTSHSSSGGDLQHTQHREHKPSDLPALPAAFHDLYASTVRPSTRDDPSLHQGRRRVNPHVAGNWPSHLYVEWHPTNREHTLLSSLLDKLRSQLHSSITTKDAGGDDDEPSRLSSFLTSDLGAPLPLHISLSRPIVLSTARKDAFLERLQGSIAASSVSPFELMPTDLVWHHSHESSRSFLVLRVGPPSSRSSPTPSAPKQPAQDIETAGDAGISKPPFNKDLSTLLRRCNDVVTSFDQPALYAARGAEVGDAFHVSIGWSFVEPSEEMTALIRDVFLQPAFKDGLMAMRIQVDGVKAKVGNVVNHVGLPVPGGGSSSWL